MLITNPIKRNDVPEPGNENPHVAEAYENLRVIRDVMERSTKHSTLSGFSGILVGIWAISGVLATSYIIKASTNYSAELISVASIWMAVIGVSVATDFVFNKSRAIRVGKQVFSKLGLQMVRASAPAFVTCLLLTLFLVQHHLIDSVWPCWMLCYGIAICSVGQFSVREVSWLGWAFIAVGAISLALPATLGLTMLALGFGGLHIVYGLYTGMTRRDW